VATAAFNDGLYEQSKEFYLELAAKQLANASDSVYLAYSYMNLERPDSAATILSDVLQRDPENYDALNKMGELSARFYNNLPVAESFLSRAIEVDPTEVSAYENMGIVKAMKREYSAALSYFEKALSLDPKNTRIMDNISTAYNAMGNKAKADEYTLKAQQEKSNNEKE
jgi:Flp pilus assembly protein TadD